MAKYRVTVNRQIGYISYDYEVEAVDSDVAAQLVEAFICDEGIGESSDEVRLLSEETDDQGWEVVDSEPINKRL